MTAFGRLSTAGPGPRPASPHRGREFSFRPKPLLVSNKTLARQIDAFGRVIDDLADNPGFPIMFFEYGQHRADVCFTDNDAKSDTHIVNLEHLGDADIAESSYHLETCRGLRHFID